MTRLKRIEVVASLKAEANLEHYGGDIVNMPSGRVFSFAS
ncbi:hypothetical protein BCBMB205_20180 [Bacillus sp. CN2]|nr:hypothetical protein BCBMB205_20180 [Bacillus velezensis]ARZ58355.1 hypothetical protein BAGQ_2122 [Bacillus velezensis]GFR56798.1 hypothetical protein BCBMB205_20180 [Bacillus sp. CN2]